MIDVGAISYINALPFFLPFLQSKVPLPGKLCFGQPTEVNAMLDQEKVSVALVSSAHFLAKRENYILLSPYGIAASKRVASVRLYFQNSIEDLHNKNVALTNASETSRTLFNILCNFYWKIQPKITEFDQIQSKTISPNTHGFLLIGDACLKNIDFHGYNSIDLAECWYDFTGKPFVFALFATNSIHWIKNPQPIKEFHNLLSQAYTLSQSDIESIIIEAEKRTGIARDILVDYYKILEYELQSEHFQGLEKFSRYITCLNNLK